MSRRKKRNRNQMVRPAVAANTGSGGAGATPVRAVDNPLLGVSYRTRGTRYPDWESAYRSLGRPEKVWTYQVPQSGDCCRVVRSDQQGGSKQCQVLTRDQAGWYVGLPPAPFVLYEVKELEFEQTVLVCENEDAADAARFLECVATTSLGGFSMAADTDWSPLNGKHVAIIRGANDNAESSAQNVAQLVLNAGALSAKIVALPGLKPGDDLADWAFEYSHDDDDRELSEELLTLVQAARFVERPEKRLSLAEIPPEPLEWVWEGVIPRGKLTLIVGEAGVGKSLFALDVVVRVTRGESGAYHDARSNTVTRASGGSPGTVILFSASEDLADLVRPRLDAAGADLSRIYPMDLVRPVDAADRASSDDDATARGENSDLQAFELRTDLTVLENELQRLDEAHASVRLIVIDPFSRYLDPADGKQAAAVRKVALQLTQLATRFRTAVVLIASADKSAMGRMGNWTTMTHALASVAQSAWVIVRDLKQAQRRLLLPLKMNLIEETTALAFFITTGVVEWEEAEVKLTGDESRLVAIEHMLSEPGTELNRAMDWLNQRLSDGPMFTTDIIAEASANDISERTLRRAYHRLGCKSARNIGCDRWHWTAGTGTAGLCATTSGSE